MLLKTHSQCIKHTLILIIYLNDFVKYFILNTQSKRTNTYRIPIKFPYRNPILNNMIRKILIVDDSPIARKILKKCLPENGYELHEASNGLLALETFKSVHPDLTFMDLTMPEMDGIQALEEIKKIDSNAAVVVVTADVQVKTIFKVMNLGALQVIKKPVSKDAIEDALKKTEEHLSSL